MKAENFIELIEQKRFDKISKNGMTLIAERFRELQTEQLTIPVVRLSLFNEVYDKFVECEDDNEFTQYLNENTNEA